MILQKEKEEMRGVINKIVKELEREKYVKDGGELFLNSSNEDCIPLRRVYEIIHHISESSESESVNATSHLPHNDYFIRKFVEVR